MIRWLLLFSLLVSVPGAQAAKKAKVRYPVVETVSGTVAKVDERITVANRQAEKTEVEKPLTKKSTFKDKAVLRTGEKAELRLLLNATTVLTIFEGSEVEFPAIAWEDGAVQEIILHRGSLRLICSENCSRKLTTALYQAATSPGDLVLRYSPSIPEVELQILQGEMAFRGLENESAVVLKAGQKASFKGVLENGEPAYDILLKGRKVAKGQMSPVQEIPAEQRAELQKQEEKQKKVAKVVPKSKRLPSQICDKPWGELNQCVWTCEKNKKNAKECGLDEGAICVRQRCNANGEWSDRQELPAQNSPCQAKQIVGTCDY